MKNFQARGDVLEITAAADIDSGQGVKAGVLFGVAAADIKEGARGVINLTGVYQLPKATGTSWSLGDAVYWSGTAATKATTAGNLLIGVAAADAASAAALGLVRLNGAAPAAVTS